MTQCMSIQLPSCERSVTEVSMPYHFQCRWIEVIFWYFNLVNVGRNPLEFKFAVVKFFCLLRYMSGSFSSKFFWVFRTQDTLPVSVWKLLRKGRRWRIALSNEWSISLSQYTPSCLFWKKLSWSSFCLMLLWLHLRQRINPIIKIKI